MVGILQVDGLFDGRDHRAVASRAVRVEDAQIQEVDLGGNAFEGPGKAGTGGVRTVAADNSGDVSAVAVLVGGTGTDEILAIDHARTVCARHAQIRVGVVNAAVDHGYGYTGARVTGLPGKIGAHRGGGDIQVALHLPVRRNILHERQFGQHRQDLCRNRDGDEGHVAELPGRCGVVSGEIYFTKGSLASTGRTFAGTVTVTKGTWRNCRFVVAPCPAMIESMAWLGLELNWISTVTFVLGARFWRSGDKTLAALFEPEPANARLALKNKVKIRRVFFMTASLIAGRLPYITNLLSKA